MPEQVTKDSRVWWWIHVTGYGGFAYFGTTAEGEQMRRHKASWEGGRGTIRPATSEETLLEREALQRRQEAGAYLDDREREALQS